MALRSHKADQARMWPSQSKIFDDSRRCWDSLDSLTETTFGLDDWGFGSVRGDVADFTSPYGNLVICTVIPCFRYDAQEIQAIASSKSSRVPHESVDVFGAAFVAEENRYNRKGKAPLGHDQKSLDEMLSHGEIRILHAPGIDVLSVRAWDGRHFLENHGGSHHLAAAIHIARAIGVDIPVVSPLHIYQLNPNTVNWIVDGFHLFLVPSNLEMLLMHYVERIMNYSILCFA